MGLRPSKKYPRLGRGIFIVLVLGTAYLHVLFEISGVSEEIAKEALRLATHKLPVKCKVVSRADLEGGAGSEE